MTRFLAMVLKKKCLPSYKQLKISNDVVQKNVPCWGWNASIMCLSCRVWYRDARGIPEEVTTFSEIYPFAEQKVQVKANFLTFQHVNHIFMVVYILPILAPQKKRDRSFSRA